MIYIHKFHPQYLHPFQYKYMKILEDNAIDYKLVDSQSHTFWEEINDCSLYIMFLGQTLMHLQRQLSLISVLDNVLGIRCFPNWNTAWHFDDKISQYYLLKSQGFPIAPSHIFWDKDLAIEWAKSAIYPQVFKLKGGAGSLNVIKVYNSKQAMKLISKMFGKGISNGNVPGVNLFKVYRNSIKTLVKSKVKYSLYELGLRFGITENWSRHQGYAFFQDFLPNNNYDTRVTIIGGRSFAFQRKNRPTDFRSSGSGIIDFSPNNIDHRCLKIAFSISQKFNFQCMAYDFLYDLNKQPIINELSCQFVDSAIYSCPGYWDENLNWYEGHLWPQYCQLQDLLDKSDLIQPEFPEKSKPVLIRIAP